MRDILKRRRRNKGDGRLPSADWLVGQGDGRGGGGVCSNGMSQPTPHSLSHFSSTSALLCPLVEAPPPNLLIRHFQRPGTPALDSIIDAQDRAAITHTNTHMYKQDRMPTLF